MIVKQLLEAAKDGRVEDIKRLLAGQVHVDCTDDTWHRTPLHLAAKAGHVDAVRLLIKQGATVNVCDEGMWTPLMLSAVYGREAVAHALIDKGADINASDKDQRTPLIWAVKNSSLSIAKALLQHNAHVNTADNDRQTPLVWAVKNANTGIVKRVVGFTAENTENTEIVKLLVRYNADINASDKDQRTPLIWAAKKNSRSTLKLLLQHYAHVNAADNAHRTALMWAVMNANTDIVKLLAANGADVNAPDKDQLFPLTWAVKKDVSGIVDLLLRHDAHVNSADGDGQTPLMWAVKNDNATIVKLLLNHGADIDATDNKQRTALIWADENWCDNVREFLVQRGARIEVGEKDQLAQLILAAKYGHLHKLQWLIDHQANVDDEDQHKRTPLMWAVMSSNPSIVALLLKHGARVNTKDKYHETPLMRAVKNDNADFVKVLLEHEADVDARDENKWTPLMWATLLGYQQVVELLTKAGAYVDAIAIEDQTALMIAAQSGRDVIVQELIDLRASIDATNIKRQTALMLAAAEGHTKVVRALLNANASIEVEDEDGEIALMYAIVNNHQGVVREILYVKNGMDQTMALLKLGLQKRRSTANRKAKGQDVELNDLLQLCSATHEAQPISTRIYARFVDLEQQLTNLNDVSKQEATPRFKQLLKEAYGFMLKYSKNHIVTRFVAGPAITRESHDINRELDALALQFNIESDDIKINGWEKQWEADSDTLKSRMKALLDKKDELSIELQDPQVQREALTLLMFARSRASEYTNDETMLIHKIFQEISSMSQLEIDVIPDWFVPPHEVKFDAGSLFARGAFGAVYRGTWNGADVVVKSALLNDKNSREMFLNETTIWSKIQHPNVVRLFKACHVGNPFFVCEWAANGTLSDYLSRDNVRFKTWAKLHEAALGLKHLHTKQKVVHGDLKCNNILISTDGSAKLSDFGLSFELTSEQEEVFRPLCEIGAINWKAPEVASGNTRGTFASDVYSFGMCIVEAVTGRVPWGMLPATTVRIQLRRRALPKQPSEMNDVQWKLVKRMCVWEPAARINISTVTETLAELALQESAAAWADHKASRETSKPLRRSNDCR